MRFGGKWVLATVLGYLRADDITAETTALLKNARRVRTTKSKPATRATISR
jgi:hypothetical protein